MSTRSIVGWVHRTNDGTEELWGVYCHSDGYPEHQLPALSQSIERLGFEGTVDAIRAADKGGISFLDPEDKHTDMDSWGAPKTRIAGLGPAYVDQPGWGPEQYAPDHDDLGLEFYYFVDPARQTIRWRASDTKFQDHTPQPQAAV